MRGIILFTLILSGCAHSSLEADEPELVISGPRTFVNAAYQEAKKCGYRHVERQIQSGGEKTADSELDQNSAQANCFGEWIAAIPDATFAVAHTTVVY